MVRLRPDAVAWREVEGEIVALDLATSTYLAVNPTGVVLWHALAEGTSADELARRLVETYEVDEPRAAADVEAFLTPLRARGLLEE